MPPLVRRSLLAAVGLALGLLLAVAAIELRGRPRMIRVLEPDTVTAVETGALVAALPGSDTPSALPPADELPWLRGRDPRMFTLDDELGFRPVLGNGVYGRSGALVNAYPLARRVGVRRVLFIGDSVVFRKRLVRAIAGVIADPACEFWNGGVDAYNTVQEAIYYKRYLAAIRPDHVILVFHNNDFECTPVAFRDTSGALRVFAPHTPIDRPVNAWLFTHSAAYQQWVLDAGFSRRRDTAALAAAVRASLAALRDEVRSESATLTVLVLPILKPFDAWSPEEKWSRAASIAILRELDIPHFDLLPALDLALRDGVRVEEDPGDFWHPSDAACARFAEYLASRGSRLSD